MEAPEGCIINTEPWQSVALLTEIEGRGFTVTTIAVLFGFSPQVMELAEKKVNSDGLLAEVMSELEITTLVPVPMADVLVAEVYQLIVPLFDVAERVVVFPLQTVRLVMFVVLVGEAA